jgi:oligopeptide/dipeptide ABC transporter ATP-binding protein
VSTVLEVHDLRVSLRSGLAAQPAKIVRGVSFSVAAGGRLGLVGESGCGKTTALMAVAGLLAPTATLSGSVRICGQELLTSPTTLSGALRRREVGVVLQGSMNALNPVRRVAHQLREAFAREIRRDKTQSARRCAELLDRVGLSRRVARAYPHELSGGMRQRVCIAIALAAEPRLLLADEPTTALDTVVQARIIELLDELCRDLGLSAVIVSHDLRLATDFCDSIAVMYGGQIVEYDSATHLASAARHPYTRLLFAATPTVESTKDEIRSIAGAPPDLRKPIVGCPFYARCPRRLDVCATDQLPVVPSSRGFALCHNPHV